MCKLFVFKSSRVQHLKYIRTHQIYFLFYSTITCPIPAGTYSRCRLQDFFSNMRKTMWVVSALVSISYLNSISCFMIKPSLPIKFIQSSIKSRSILKIFSFYNFTHSRIVIFDSSLTKDAFISLLILCCVTIVTILLLYTLSFKHFSL